MCCTAPELDHHPVSQPYPILNPKVARRAPPPLDVSSSSRSGAKWPAWPHSRGTRPRSLFCATYRLASAPRLPLPPLPRGTHAAHEMGARRRRRGGRQPAANIRRSGRRPRVAASAAATVLPALHLTRRRLRPYLTETLTESCALSLQHFRGALPARVKPACPAGVPCMLDTLTAHTLGSGPRGAARHG
jgi:hypothetical protein